MTDLEFLRRVEELGRVSAYDRALALLWWAGGEDPTVGMTSRAICDVVEAAGHAKQNVARLNAGLAADRRVTRTKGDVWRLHPRTRKTLDAEYAFALTPPPPPASDSVLPRELFVGTRGYIERVVEQINRSYDTELWDCCAVMCRRLLETLIIEVYEKAERTSEIKGSDGHFLMLNGLISCIEADPTLNLSRNASQGLKDFKKLGDLSAHNRRFNAQRDDINRVRDGLRVAAEELLHLAGFR